MAPQVAPRVPRATTNDDAPHHYKRPKTTTKASSTQAPATTPPRRRCDDAAATTTPRGAATERRDLRAALAYTRAPPDGARAGVVVSSAPKGGVARGFPLDPETFKAQHGRLSLPDGAPRPRGLEKRSLNATRGGGGDVGDEAKRRVSTE